MSGTSEVAAPTPDRSPAGGKADASSGRPGVLLGSAHLAALWALAFLQPMLSVLGGSPDFFVARGNTSGQIIVYALVLAFAAPLVFLAIEAIAERFGSQLRWRVHLVLMALVGSALVLSLIKDLPLPGVLVLALAIAVAIAGVWAYDGFAFPRTFMNFLTPAPIVILLWFFFLSGASKLILPGDEPKPIDVEIPRKAPVVLVILDELPVAHLMEDPNSIDESRYPAIARLASQSTWYRNASSAAAFTTYAVPAILTGRRPRMSDLPTAADHPQSIFTLLGGQYSMNVDEFITRVCPAELCPESKRKLGEEATLGSLFSDLNIVSQYLLLPPSLTNHLPSLSGTFGGFGQNEQQQAVAREERGAGQRLGKSLAKGTGEDALVGAQKFADRIGKGPQPSLNVIHIDKPHSPWSHLPNGERFTQVSEWKNLRRNRAEKWDASQPVVDQALQRHLLSVGYADKMFGVIESALKRKGLWDRSLVVLTADHGAGFRSGVEHRNVVRGNVGAVTSVPMFIKAPGQKTGKIVDRNSCVNTIVPKVAAGLGIDYPWEQDECSPGQIEQLDPLYGSVTAPIGLMARQRLRELARVRRLFGTGTGWAPLYRLGPGKQLIGRDVGSLEVLPKQQGKAAIPDRRIYKFYRSDKGGDYRINPRVLQRGRLTGVGEDKTLAVAVDGRIAAVGVSFLDQPGNKESYSILLPPELADQSNESTAIYEVRGGALIPLYSGPAP